MARQTFKKQFTSPEVINQINPKNLKLMDLYLKDKNRKCSDATMKVYRSNLNIFFCWNVIYNDNKYYPEIKKRELSEFFDFLVNELKIQGKRFAHYRSVLSTLSEIVIKYYDDEFPTFKNIVNTIIEPIPKDAVRKKTILTETEVEFLLDVLKQKNKVQEACCFALAVYSGMRIAEIEQMTVDMIDRENSLSFGGVSLQTTKTIRTKGFGKQGKVMHKHIVKDLFLPYFDAWIEEREKILQELNIEDHGFLFLKRNGERATQNVIRNWAEKWSKIVEKDVYLHCLRHNLVTYLTKLGLGSDFIIAFMGWSTADMYKVYNDLEMSEMEWKDSEKLQAVINKKLEEETE
jgi:integrase